MSLSQRHAQTVDGILPFRVSFKVFSRVRRSVTWNSACGPLVDAGSPSVAGLASGVGPSPDAGPTSNTDPPSDTIISLSE